ncbi:hypothetical protein [Mycoplasma ovis]|nr:hypothetical protein [Mycoplasma ovis]
MATFSKLTYGFCAFGGGVITLLWARPWETKVPTFPPRCKNC